MKRAQAVRLIAGMGVAPLAWMLQMMVSEPLVAQLCFPGPAARTAALPGLTPALGLLGGACLTLALGGFMAAWSAWRGSGDPAGHEGALDRGTRPAGFLALLGMMASGLFSCAIVFTSLAPLLVAPC